MSTRKSNAARHESPLLTRRWWIPTGFVLVVLVLLLCMPLVVGYRVRQLREKRADVIDDARVRVNDLEAAFATELLTITASHDSIVAPGTVAATASRSETEDEDALDSLSALLGRDAVEQLVQLRGAEQRWRRRAAERRAAGVIRPTADDVQGGRDVLTAAEHLDGYLYRISLSTRNEVRNLEMLDELSAIVLAPVALIALWIVFSMGRRMMLIAKQAEDERNALQRSIERRTTLIHGVTHDVKNPLGAASGYASLLEDEIAGPLNPQQREMLGRVQRLVRIAQETIAELLELARADAGELNVSRVSTDLSQILHDLVADYQLAADQKKIELSKDDAASPAPVMTDPLRARQVAENLLSNAIKYTPPGGTVRVGIVDADESTTPAHRRGIAVRDTGPGVPENLRDRIFDEFFRVPATEGSTAGTGLGLAVSRRIARLLGGDVTIDDAPGGGSKFTFWLPDDGAN
jgi:signal transduction histidine kinase